MKITMDMSSYEIEQNTTMIEYDEEIMSVGWNYDVELVCGLQEIETSANVSTSVSEIILRQMYSYHH